MTMSFLFRSADKKHAQTNLEEKRHFLEPGSIAILPSVAGKLQQLIRLPPQTDIHEWLATNSLAFFSQVNIQVGVISELCTTSSCPQMTAGSQVYELELDKSDKKKKSKMHAKQYIDTVMTNIHKQIQDEEIFPTKFGLEFPVDFVQTVRKIFRQYFYILAHIYFHHFTEFRRLQLHDGLNTLLLHFNYFVKEFSLVEQKDLAILDDLVEQLRLHEQALSRRPRSDDYTDSTDHVSISTSS